MSFSIFIFLKFHFRCFKIKTDSSSKNSLEKSHLVFSTKAHFLTPKTESENLKITMKTIPTLQSTKNLIVYFLCNA